MAMKPEVRTRRGQELRLSGEALTGILRAVLAKGRPFRFRAGGWSMSPFIKDGDVITVAPLAGRRPRAGQVVAFLHPGTGTVAVHRVVRTEDGRFSVRGDNSYAPDGTLPPERILGAVTRIERGGRKVRGTGRAASAAVAFLSRTGALVRGLSISRRLAGRANRRGS